MIIKKKRYIQTTFTVLCLLIIGATVLLNSPKVQQQVGVVLASELENRIGTRVVLGKLHWLFPNDIVIDSVEINDQEGEKLLTVTRMAAKVEWMPLLMDKQLSICNVRLFSPSISLYKEDKEGPTNLQFILDAFASNKEKKKKKLNLRINSLLIRHADLSYQVHSEKQTKQIFNPSHIRIEDLSTHLSLKTLTNDSISVILRELSFKEQSGIQVDDLRFRLIGSRQGATLANFQMNLPHTSLVFDTIWTNYNLNNPKESMIVKGAIRHSYLTPSDLGSLIPYLKDYHTRTYIAGEFLGDNTRWDVKGLSLYTQQKDIVLFGEGSIRTRQGMNSMIQLSIDQAMIARQGWNTIRQNLPILYARLPQELPLLGKVVFKGKASIGNNNASIHLGLSSDIGHLKTSFALLPDKHYKGSVTGDIRGLRQVITKSPLDGIHLNLTAKGQAYHLPDNLMMITEKDSIPLFQSVTLAGKVEGALSQIDINGYTYDKIELSGNHHSKSLNGTIALTDRNGKLTLATTLNHFRKDPFYELQVKADCIDLHAMRLIPTHKDTKFSMQLNSSFMGEDIHQLQGKLSLDSVTMYAPNHQYSMPSVTIYSEIGDNNQLSIQSSFMNGSLYGNFTYASLGNSISHILGLHLPSLFTYNEEERPDNLCSANLKIDDTDFLQEFLSIPLETNKSVNVIANLHDQMNTIDVQLIAPQITYNDRMLHNIGITCATNDEGIALSASGTISSKDNIEISANINANAADDIINLGTNWNSTPEGMFDGNFFTTISVSHDKEGTLNILTQTDSSTVTIDKAQWNLYPFQFHYRPQHIAIKDFHFSHENQFMSIDGATTPAQSDTLKICMNEIDLNYLLNLVKLKGISFGGIVSGDVQASQLYSDSIDLQTNLDVKDFTFCNGLLGDAKIHGHWDTPEKGFFFEGKVNEVPQRTTGVLGHYKPYNEDFNLQIDADSTNLGFLNSMLSNFAGNIQGRAYGRLTLGGNIKHLDLWGNALADATMMIKPTNVHYHFTDTLRFTPGKIAFENITVYDPRGEKGTLNGEVTHNRLKEWGYDLNINAHNILGIDLPNTGDNAFYTTIYASADVRVHGSPTHPLQVDVMNARPDKGSVFALNIGNKNVSSKEDFITIVDRSSKRSRISNPLLLKEKADKEQKVLRKNKGKFSLNISTTITPDATIKLVMDPKTDDHISASGYGDLQIGVKGNHIDLFGTYNIQRGFYRLSIEDVINKDFEVVEGSTVSFDGDPMNAHLNITASHMVNYVPLKDLAAEAASMGNVRVNCLLKIGGSLNNPTLGFALELPQGTEEEKNLLRSCTSTEEQTNLQFIYLLGLGKFYSFDNTQTTDGTQGSNDMESFLATTISGQINSLLSNIIHSEKWNLSSNIRTENLINGDNENSWDNMEIEGILEGHLLDNRLIVNGNFGYRDNPMYASNFIGDFDIRYLLRPQGNLSLKGYNKTNDRYFTKTSLTTQGIGLIYQKEFDRIFPKRKRKTKIKPSNDEKVETMRSDSTLHMEHLQEKNDSTQQEIRLKGN